MFILKCFIHSLSLFLSYKLTVFGLMQNFLYLRCKYRFAICIFCFFWGENIIRKVERCIFLWHSTCLLFYASHWHKLMIVSKSKSFTNDNISKSFSINQNLYFKQIFDVIDFKYVLLFNLDEMNVLVIFLNSKTNYIVIQGISADRILTNCKFPKDYRVGWWKHFPWVLTQSSSFWQRKFLQVVQRLHLVALGYANYNFLAENFSKLSIPYA